MVNQQGNREQSGGPIPLDQLGDATREALIKALANRSQALSLPLEKLPNIIKRTLPIFAMALLASCAPVVASKKLEPTPTTQPVNPDSIPVLPKPTETPAPQPTPTVEGPTIPGKTLAIGGETLALKTIPGRQLSTIVGAEKRGLLIVTDEAGNSSFFTGYAGAKGKEIQVAVLAQGPQENGWDEKNLLWKNGNKVTVPDVLLPGGWNEEKKMAGPSHEAETIFLFKDNGSYRVGILYSPGVVAQIPDKSNLQILPDGRGLYLGGPKNFDLQTGQNIVRENDGNLRLVNPDGSWRLMRTSWENVTSKDQLYQAGVFAGPLASMAEVPYPGEKLLDTKATDAPIVQYAKAYGLNAEAVKGGLTFQEKKDVKGSKFAVAVAKDGTPLFIATQDQKSGEWGWEKATSRKIADKFGLTVGAAYSNQGLNNPNYQRNYSELANKMIISSSLDADLIFKNFTNADWRRMLSSWETVKTYLYKGEVPPGFNYSWGTADSAIAFALRNNIKEINAQHLLWRDIPDSIYKGSFTPEELERILEFTTKTRVLKYKDVINHWNAVDEMVSKALYDKDKSRFWYDMFGYGIAPKVMRWVYEANPDATIGIVDELGIGNTDFHKPYDEVTKEFIRFLQFVRERIPEEIFNRIVVGVEGYQWIYGWDYNSQTNIDNIRLHLDQMKALGYKVYISESAVVTSEKYPTWPNRPRRTQSVPNKLLAQAKIQEAVAKINFSMGAKEIGLGGTADYVEWFDFAGYTDASAMMFDDNGEPKPSYYAFLKALLEASK